MNWKRGDPVKKETGDYRYYGRVAGVFKKRSGALRVVVENDAGMLFIFNPLALEPWEECGWQWPANEKE